MRGKIRISVLLVLPALWLCMFATLFLKAALDLAEVPSSSVLLTSLCLLVSGAGFYIAAHGSRAREFKEPPPLLLTLGVGLTVLWVLGDVLVMIYSPSTAGMSLAEIRLHKEDVLSEGLPPLISYFSYCSSSIGYLAAFLIWSSHRRVGLALFWLFCAAVFGIVVARTAGGRFPFICIMLVPFSIMLVRHWVWLRRHIVRSLLLGGVALVLFIAANVYYGTLRADSTVAEADLEVKGNEILNSFGIRHTHARLARSVGQLDEYSGKSIGFLDYYLDLNNIPPQWGQFNFPLIARQFKVIDWMELKSATDEVLLSVGVNYNVWATGLRDVYVDFGWWTPVYCFLVFGFLFGRSYRDRERYFGASFTFVLLFASAFAMPWFGLLRANGYATALLIGLLIWSGEILYRQYTYRRAGRPSLDGSTGLRRLRPAGTDGATRVAIAIEH